MDHFQSLLSIFNNNVARSSLISSSERAGRIPWRVPTLNAASNRSMIISQPGSILSMEIPHSVPQASFDRWDMAKHGRVMSNTSVPISVLPRHAPTIGQDESQKDYIRRLEEKGYKMGPQYVNHYYSKRTLDAIYSKSRQGTPSVKSDAR